MPITSMEIYMVDPDGDGIGLQFKYDEETNEIEKVATPIEDNELTFWDEDMDEEDDEVWNEEITDQFHTAAVSKRLLN